MSIINYMLNYQSKYIKYKQKYLRLQKINKQFGGNIIWATSANFEIKKELFNDKYIYIITNFETNITFACDKNSNLFFIIDMIENNYKFYLIKIDDSGHIISNDDLESYNTLSFINEIVRRLGHLNTEMIDDLKRDLNRTYPHINILELYKYGQILNILAAQEKIVELNALLQAKCPKLTIVFDYMYKLKNFVPIIGDSNYNKLILCLYYKSDEEPINYNCISNIELSHINNTLEIVSFTTPSNEGKKYNKFLRAVIIIISELIINIMTYMPIQKIISTATNPISAFLLINSFGAIIEDYEHEFYNFTDGGQITYELINEFIKENALYALNLIINIDEAHIKIAYEQFHLLIDHIGTKDLIDKQLKCE
jgi:hypothetical protein